MNSSLPDDWLYARIVTQLVGTAGTVGEPLYYTATQSYNSHSSGLFTSSRPCDTCEYGILMGQFLLDLLLSWLPSMLTTELSL